MWQRQQPLDCLLPDSQQHQWGVLVTALPQRYGPPRDLLVSPSGCRAVLDIIQKAMRCHAVPAVPTSKCAGCTLPIFGHPLAYNINIIIFI